MRWTLLPLLTLLASAPADARTILCYGDSMTVAPSATDPSSYPAQMQRLLGPSDTVINGGRAGDRSDTAARLTGLLKRYHPEVVVIMTGVNDVATTPVLRPELTVRNLLRLARLARLAGARVLLVTQPPSAYLFPDGAQHPADVAQMAARTEHTRQVSHLLNTTRFVRSITVLDLRDRWATEPGGWPALTDDGLHPNAAGRARLAAWVAGALAE